MYALEMVQEHTRMSKEGYSKKRMDLIVKVCIYFCKGTNFIQSRSRPGGSWLLPVWVYKLNYVVRPCLRNKTKMKERTKLYSKARLQYRSVNSRLRLSKDQLVLGLSA